MKYHFQYVWYITNIYVSFRAICIHAICIIVYFLPLSIVSKKNVMIFIYNFFFFGSGNVIVNMSTLYSTSLSHICFRNSWKSFHPHGLPLMSTDVDITRDPSPFSHEVLSQILVFHLSFQVLIERPERY